jgi:hypothetical protein
MKKIVLTISFIALLASCKETNKETEVASTEPTTEYQVFGDSISAEGALSNEEMMAKYKDLKEGDTLEVAFKSVTKEVCQKKGCWMTMDLGDENKSFVKFKDYAFFVPKNGQDKETVVKGKAYVSIESVDELKHYAKDAGKSQAAIDSIVEPKVTYSFMADGVLMAK